jgi:hypothetical protein
MDLSRFIIATSRFKSPEEFAHHLGSVVLKKIDNQLKARKEHRQLAEAKNDGAYDDIFGNDSLFMKSVEEDKNEAREY